MENFESFWNSVDIFVTSLITNLSYSLLLLLWWLQKNPQALLSLFYLCSSNIYALINYVGFATWVKCTVWKFKNFSAISHKMWEKASKILNFHTVMNCLYSVSNFKIAIYKNFESGKPYILYILFLLVWFFISVQTCPP